MRIIVLGASGYLGGRVANYLAESGHEVIGQWRRPPGGIEGHMVPHGWKAVVSGDLRDPAAVARLATFEAEGVVDLVALNHKQCEIDRVAALVVNAGTAWNILEILSVHGLQRFIYFSTQQVYGRLSRGTINETWPVRPFNAYGATHLAAETLLQARGATLGVQVASIRLSNGCGAPAWTSADCWWLVINDLCRSARTEGFIRLASDGTPTRDFLHISDVASGVENLLMHRKLDHSVYNLGSGTTLTILELAHLVAAVHFRRYGVRPKVLLLNGSESISPTLASDFPRFVYDSSRIRERGWAPSTSIEAAMAEVFSFLDANG